MNTGRTLAIARRRAFQLGMLCLAACPVAFGWTKVEDGLTAAKEGSVIEAKTGRPLAHAWVVALWLHGGYTYVEGSSRSGCFHSLVTQTDENGTYRIPDVGKTLDVTRSWSLLSQDAYGWGLVFYAPDHFQKLDFNQYVLLEVMYSEDPEKAIYNYSPTMFVGGNRAHPSIEYFKANGTAHLADVVLDSTRVLPAALHVVYLDEIEQRSRCQTEKQTRSEMMQALYMEAYRTACMNNASYRGASFGLDLLWEATGPHTDHVERDTALRKISEKAYYNKNEYPVEDLKQICELTRPDTEGVK